MGEMKEIFTPNFTFEPTMNVVKNDILTTSKKYVFFRKPKSKKKRIIKKWRKRKENWRIETSCQVFRYGNTLFVPTAIYDEYKKRYIKD